VDPADEPPDGEFRHDASGRDYAVVRRDGALHHRETLRDSNGSLIAQADHPLRWLVGSGRHSRTYLIETDGFLAESPVTWYESQQAWGLSPGYDQAMHQSFGRPADWGCLYCHVGRAEPVEGAYHRLAIHEQAIGCERCHGPGAEHAARFREGSESALAADRIAHPAKLPRVRQEDICAQCHLRGEATVPLTGRSLDDFHPGMRLSDVRLDYGLRSSDSMNVVGHVEQMRLSACYQKSEDLTCITCHEMHSPPPPDEAFNYYRQRCLSCHAEESCGLEASERRVRNAQDNCAACHMPQVETDIPHIAFTHHRIGIHSLAPGLPKRDSDLAAGATDLLAYGDVSHVSEAEQERCLGLAYLEASSKSDSRAASDAYRRRARSLLETALARTPGDGEVAAALAKMYWMENHSGALQLAQAALRDPRISSASRVNALFVAGEILLESGQAETALTHLKELTQLRRIAEDHLLLAGCQAELGRFAEAEEAALVAVRIDPFRAEAYDLLAKIAQQRGDSASAEVYRQKMEKLSALAEE
jgi:tetratricopeptide (TPR) repeat protein